MTEQKIIVTDEMVLVAQSAYDYASYHPSMDRTVRMGVALEAVFDMVNEQSANNAQCTEKQNP